MNCVSKSFIKNVLKYRVAAYCRVSTSLDDQLNSFDRQEQMYRAEIMQHDDWELYKIFFDKGLSGTDVLNRRGFLTMVDAGLEREYDILITREVSRLSRNIQHFYEFIRPLVKAGVWIIFIDDEIDTHMSDFETRASGLISHAQDESRKTSQRVRRGQSIAMHNGSVFGSPAYGYKNNSLKEDPSEMDIVKYIFDLYVNQHFSLRKIKQQLEDDIIPSPHGCTTWSTKVIRDILKNEKYCGDLVQGKTKTIDYLTHERVRSDEHIIINDHHIPAISRIEWENAQKRLGSNTVQKYTGKYIFSGKIKCASCGKSFIARRRSSVLVWKCSSIVQNGSSACDNKHQLRNDAAMHMLNTCLSAVEFDRSTLYIQMRRLIHRTLRVYKGNEAAIFDRISELIYFKGCDDMLLRDILDTITVYPDRTAVAVLTDFDGKWFFDLI